MGKKKKVLRLGVLGLVVGLVGFDLIGGGRLDSDVELIVPQVDTAMLGESTVVIATSLDLEEPVPLDRELSYEQVDAIVKKAIHLDQSTTNLAAKIEPGDWVAIKVNIVTAPMDPEDAWTWFWGDDQPHWGQDTDLRVVKSVIDYLINEEGDASRITIVEGAAEWSKLGETGTDPGQKEDGWTVHWEKFDNLSYVGIIEEFDGVNGTTVDLVDLNYDDWVGTDGVGAGDPLPVPDPNHTGIGGYQRPEEGYYVSKTLMEVDKLINIPAMKTHDTPGVTLIHKNYVGTYMQRAYGGRNNSKMGLHNYIPGLGNLQVTAGFVDMFSYRPTDYGIIEGFWGTEGAGPQRGDNINHNVVIASGDPVAADAVGAWVMGYNPEDIWYLKFSAAKGFGTYDLEQIQVVGRPIAEVQRDFAKTPLDIWASRREPNMWGWGNRAWLLNGPYESDGLDGALIADEGGLLPLEGEEINGIPWTVHRGLLTPRAQLLELPEGYIHTNSVTYAFAYIHSDREQDGYLYVAGNDGLKVWLNGKEVFVGEDVKEKLLSNEATSISLHPGPNPVMVKVHNQFGSSNLALVVGDKDGDTLPGIKYLLEPEMPVTAVLEEESGRPTGLELKANFPNPFNPETVIPYALPQRTHVQLAVYDVRGARVRTLVDRDLTGGPHQTRWDGRDDTGRAVASGVYLYQLRAGAQEMTRKMLLVR